METIRTPKVDNVSLVERFSSRRNAVGSLYLTATHLIYVDHDNKRETWILHSHISSVGKLPLSTSGSPLQIRTKTFLSLTFIVPKERDAHDLYTSLTQMCQPENIEDLYCFRYNIGTEEVPKDYGWNFFNIQADFERMKVPPDSWTMTTLNKDYDLCDTYPRYLYVPTTAPTSVLIGSSRFRSRGRLPVMTYLHTNKAALCRCSQPLSGFSARCVEDENLLVCIQKANPNTAQLVVVDTRPKINAMANRAAGKGYESEANYENTRFMFAGIDNIHVMRSSLARVVETCDLKSQLMSAFLNGLEGSGWLKHIKSIIDAALSVARTLEDGSSVLVHCSDGWDRTAQVCGLAQVLLDPYYRTFEGFQALISKEWLEFGHKFTDRSGHTQVDPKEVSPVFTQWLECIWQLSQQYQFVFEFNERLLLTIHDHLYSCQFGTFIGNCQKDRIDLRVSEKTYSIWGYLTTHKNEYINPLYQPEANVGCLFPNIVPQTLRFWRGMYCRWENGLHPRESLNDLATAYKDHLHSLNDHIRLLKKRIKYLEENLSEPAYTNGNNSDLNADDNRFHYKKSLIEQVSLKIQHNIETDHPLIDGLREWKFDSCKPNSLAFDSNKLNSEVEHDLSLEELTDELESVALEWKSVRAATECPCSTPLDFASFKRHCSRCGGIFCSRCLEKLVTLPGHITLEQSRVCILCYKSCFPKSLESPE